MAGCPLSLPPTFHWMGVTRNQVRSQRLTLLLLLAGGALVLFGVFLLSQHLTSGPTDTSTAKVKPEEERGEEEV